MKKITGILMILCLVCPLLTMPLYADDIPDVNKVMKTSMNDVLSVVKSASTAEAEKRKKLWTIVLRTFDFKKITEFALGKFSSTSTSNLGEYGDRRFSPEQHFVFETLFTKHLGNTYLDRLEFDNLNVKIDVSDAVMLKAKKKMKRARVNTIINDKTPIDYMLLKRDGVWRVYDLKVEGRSLVSAFRKEYKAVLLKNKPDYLINLLKGKIAEHDAAKAKKKETDKKNPKKVGN